MDSVDARRPEHTPLMLGGKLRCPRCGTVSDILNYFTFERQEPYADELNVVYKCRAKVRSQSTGRIEPCRYIFSPGLRVEELLRAA